MTNTFTRLAGAVLLLSTFGATAASAITIDFSLETPGTVVTTQFAGLTFSLTGGPSSATAPIIGYGFFDTAVSLNNSGFAGINTNGYPTGDSIWIDFAAAASGVSFTFNNYGNGNGSFVNAYDAANALISSQGIDSVNGFATVNVAGSNISHLRISNNTGGSNDWIFGVGQLTYAAVPEPASWALMIAGFGMVGGAMRRRTAAVAA